MLKGFKYRISPTASQEVLLNKHIGSARWVYNNALEAKTRAYADNKVNLSSTDLIKRLPHLKKEHLWLKEVNSQSLQATIRYNIDNAFKGFFNAEGGYPKYKSKRGSKQSFHIPQNVLVENGKLIIPKFKEGINIVLHRETRGVIRSATISKTPTGKYFVSIMCDTDQQCKPKTTVNKETTTGIDLGIKNFFITSEGDVRDNPTYLRKSESRLKYLQRRYSKYKGKRTKKRIAKSHEKVANQRKDFLHKESFKLVSENQTIAIEDLHVKGMLKNHCLAKSISDASWSTFTSMLEYKCEWYGVNLLKIGRFEPSSKTCSLCGTVNQELTLSHREWTCTTCTIKHDRDLNAAVNIKNFALRNYVSGTDTKTRNELPALVGVLTSEAHPIGAAVGG